MTEADLRELDAIRRSYSPGYEKVILSIRSELGLEPTGRPAKSTSSIIEKLQRETIRLSQMQDIAGCRIVVADAPAQEVIVGALRRIFKQSLVVDRRARPSHGYRAVHVVAEIDRIPIEIQVRTGLQHAWAELSEKYADVHDSSIKYGGGPAETRTLLDTWSELIQRLEVLELEPSHVSPPELEQIKSGMRTAIEAVIGELKGSTE